MAIGAHAPEPDDDHLFRAIVADIDGAAIAQAIDQAATPAPAPPQVPATPPPAPAPNPDQERAAAPTPPPPAPPAPSRSDRRRAKRAAKAAVADEATLPQQTVPKRTVRDALVDWIDRRSGPKAAKAEEQDEDSAITLGAFVAVGVMTIVVAGLAFALSFDMMLEAAKHYGWGPRLAGLFPIIIDVGAIGGTFMGAISANRVYRRIGHQVLVVTLAASVLFNLVGHDIKGGKPLMSGLPDKWGWTGTVAAVLIPLLLAYFVHAFSKALKTFTDQRRAAAAVQQRQQQQRAAAAHHARQAELARQAREAAPKPAASTVNTAAKRNASTAGGGRASKDDAIRIGIEKKAATPAALRTALTGAGYALPASSTTVENWCREIKAQLSQLG